MFTMFSDFTGNYRGRGTCKWLSDVPKMQCQRLFAVFSSRFHCSTRSSCTQGRVCGPQRNPNRIYKLFEFYRIFDLNFGRGW